MGSENTIQDKILEVSENTVLDGVSLNDFAERY